MMIRTGFKLGAIGGALALAATGVIAANQANMDRSKLPTPSAVVAAAPQGDWVEIQAEDLLVMDLPPLATPTGNKPRRVVIQLMPAPFSQGWVGNIKKLATAHWWDGTAIVRVQDNYVTQWGDPDGEDKAKAKPLPKDLVTVAESDYATPFQPPLQCIDEKGKDVDCGLDGFTPGLQHFDYSDQYANGVAFSNGWPVGVTFGAGRIVSSNKAGNVSARSSPGWPELKDGNVSPLHCYGAVGVGRNLSPDTGSGAELYTVIGQAPRQLDRNIAVVGRVISGMEWLSSLPRGTGDLGFYVTPQERTPITSVRLASELPASGRPRFEYMNTESKSFADYLKLRANRHDSFYNVPAGGVDICNAPVPVRAVKVR